MYGMLIRISWLRLSFGIVVLLSAVSVDATSIRAVKLDELFKEADQVVLVKIVVADDEHYETAVYKAVVESAYKGAHVNDTIYFGPFEGRGLGLKYLLFTKAGAGESAKQREGAPFGDLARVSREMYAGYAALAVGYECVFDGAELDKQCDNSVQVNPEQIVLPAGMKTFPKGDPTTVTNYKKWVRLGLLEAYLTKLATAR